jgi:xanthine dehydrogenase accessory factor
VSWIGNIVRELARHGAIVRVTVIRADGSTPRETGAAMLVGVAHIVDTIGGGAFELGERPLPVTRAVREMLSGLRPLPALIRAAKGASVWFVEPLERRMVPLHIYGAGHVGRALVRVLADLPFRVTWADTAASRFPNPVPPHACAQAAPDLPAVAAAAPADAFHVVMTYSHALDLAICHAVLRRGQFGHLGLIGSATKRARFTKRLADLGISPPLLARLTCPIGLPGIGGKEPGMIAVSVAAKLLELATQRGDVVAGPARALGEDRSEIQGEGWR